MDDLKAAAVCMNAVPGEVEKNLDRIQSFVSKASAKGVSIICFPVIIYSLSKSNFLILIYPLPYYNIRNLLYYHLPTNIKVLVILEFLV